MNQIRTAVAALIAAWGLISDFQLPRSFIQRFRMKVPAVNVLVSMPWVGMAAGFLVLAAAWLVRLIFNPSAGALVFALAGTLLFFLKDSGRGFSLLLSYAANRFTGEPAVTALNRADSRLTELLKNPVLLLISVITVVLVLGMLFMLFYRGAGLWFAAVIGADALIQARLCLETDRNTRMPFLHTAGKGRSRLGASAATAAVLMLICFPAVAALGAIVILWVWFWRELPNSGEFQDGWSADWVTMYGFGGSLITLLCGMGLL